MTTLTGPAFAVDGVPVHYRQTPGPTRATLSFRVGTADERLPQRGITRLLTYVAAAASGIDSPTTFVRTSFTMTSFSFSGNADDVAHDIGALCHSLTNLDPRILDRQRQVVLRGAHPHTPAHSPEHSALLRARYGPDGWGADGLPEFGVPSLELEALRAWSAQNFTAGNLVTCVSGPRPRKLRIPLPAGDLRPVPEPVSQPDGTPSVRRMPSTQLSIGGVLEFGADADLARTATGLLGTLIRGRAVNAIQQQLGLRLGARTSTLAMGAHRAHIALWSDTTGIQRARATDVAIGALESLVADGVSATEAEFYCSRRRGALEATARSARGIHALAEQEVVGALIAVPWSAHDELARLDQISPALLGEQAAALLDSVLLVGPPQLRPPRPWPEAVGSTAAPIDGTTHRSRPAYLRRGGSTAAQRPSGAEGGNGAAAIRRLSVGAEGAYLRGADGADVTLRWPDVQLTAAYDDGRRLLMDRRGSTLDVRPEEWLHPHSLTEQIDAATPPASVVQLGRRRTPTGTRLRITDRLPWWVWIPLGLIAALLVVAAGVAPASAASLWLRVGVGVLGAVVLVLTARCAAVVWGSGRLLRRPRS